MKLCLFTLVAHVCISLSVGAFIQKDPSDIKRYKKFLDRSNDGKYKDALPGLVYHQSAWERSGKYEGDILLTDKQKKYLLNDYMGVKNALVDRRRLWPDGRAYYSIAAQNFTQENLDDIRLVIRFLQRASCVILEERTNQPNYILITGRDEGCYANIGMVGGEQMLNLAPSTPQTGCFTRGVIVHELLHALGFFHMHSTYNRDDFVKIFWDKIMPVHIYNFQKHGRQVVTDLGQEYDYGSILHYSEYAFSIDGNKTILPTKVTSEIIGQRIFPSVRDLKKLNLLYNCIPKNRSDVHNEDGASSLDA